MVGSPDSVHCIQSKGILLNRIFWVKTLVFKLSVLWKWGWKVWVCINLQDILYQPQQIGSSSFYHDEVETPSSYWMEWENCIEIFYFFVDTTDTLEDAFTKQKNRREGKKKQSIHAAGMMQILRSTHLPSKTDWSLCLSLPALKMTKWFFPPWILTELACKSSCLMQTIFKIVHNSPRNITRYESHICYSVKTGVVWTNTGLLTWPQGQTKLQNRF